MYLDGHRADGKTVWLKPYYYVLNNILFHILYPKIGDSTNLCEDSQVVLDCFGDEFTKFSISRYIWDKIFVASEDVVKHYPYVPFIMHIIEHVSGIHFPINTPHKVLKLSNQTSLQAKRELEEIAKGKGKGKGALGSSSHHASPPCASRSRRAHSEEPQSSSSSGGKPPSKFQFFMKYMFRACCASAEREQEMLVRMHRIEQKLDIPSTLP